jgi:DNA (cytosine-5)-methyltransferase 1
MRHLDLFSGIGGFALAAQSVWDDCETVAFVDNDDFCQSILEMHWPNVPIYDDIRQFTRSRFQRDFGYTTVDLLTGGFPCQPFSTAGSQRAQSDDRYLWPEMLRLIDEFRPRWVIGENVAGIINLALDEVLAGLADAGYATEAFVIPACALDAWHRRDRVWIVAHSDDHGLDGTEDRQGRTEGDQRDAARPIEVCQPEGSDRVRLGTPSWHQDWQEAAARLCGVAYGVPDRAHRIKALGNAIVPQVAAEIMTTIKSVDENI